MAATVFERQRERVGQQAGAQAEQASGALRRRFAATGMGNSGAAIAAEQQAQERGNQARAGAIADVDAAEAQDSAQKAEVQANRDFQSGEAEKGRKFEGGYRDKEFEFNKMNADRQFGLSERQFDRQMQFNQEESAFNRRMAKHEANSGFFGGSGFLGLGSHQFKG